MRLLSKLLIYLFVLGATPLAVHSDEQSQLSDFARAYTHYKEGNYTGAKEIFQKTLNGKFSLADYSLYYLATMAFEEKRWEECRALAARLKQAYSQSLWVDTIELQLARADLAEAKFTQAAATLRGLREKKSANRTVQAEALFFLARTAQDNPKYAHSLYQELREQFPTSSWTPSARREQENLRAKHPEIFPFHTVTSLIGEADQLIRERAFEEAEIIYKKLLNNSEDTDLQLRLLSKLSTLHLTLRRRSEAIPLLERIARDYPETTEAPRALYQIGQILWNRHDNTQALALFQQVLDRYPTSTINDRALYATGDIYEWLGNRELAITHYNKIRLHFSEGQVRDDATWRLAWLYYRGGEFPEAYRTFKILLSEARSSALRTAAHYWQGRAADRAGDRELAKKIYGEVYSANAESYYQALAAAALSRLGSPPNEAPIRRPASLGNYAPPSSPRAAFHLARARALSSLALHSLAVEEIKAIEDLGGSDKEVKLFLSGEYFKNQAYRRSLAVATQLPISEYERDYYRFPLAHWESIQSKARERGIDPYLILALIRQESLFDARARSPARALGLMQLLPSTAARVARRIGMAAPSNEMLFDPEVNLALGTKYLQDLLQRYSDNWFKAIAAYNAGEGAVDRWEREIVTDDIEEFVERIPYQETRTYVKLVMRNHRIYSRLYEKKQ